MEKSGLPVTDWVEILESIVFQKQFSSSVANKLRSVEYNIGNIVGQLGVDIHWPCVHVK